MTEYLSHKIRILSALSILMVLYIHMYYSEMGGASLQTVEGIVGGGLCSVAVPLFYLISGYLFFLKVPNGLTSVAQKMKKRCRTLLVPYLLANGLTFLFYALLNVITWKVPAIDRVVNFKVLDGLSGQGLWPTLRLVFIDPPIAFQLWFVRDLMVIILVAPILYLLMKRIVVKAIYGWLAMALLFAAFVCFHHVRFVPAAFWFVSGGLLAMSGTGIEHRRPPLAVALICIALYLLMSVGCGTGVIPDALKRFIPFVGIPALWFLYDHVVRRSRKILAHRSVVFFSSYTFFVYLCHEPLLNIFKKVPLLLSRSEAVMMTSYLCVPMLFYLFACLLGHLLKKAAPRGYAIYTGGR